MYFHEEELITVLFIYYSWRRKWLLTAVFWPREFHGLYSPWGRKVSETTEHLSLHLYIIKDKYEVIELEFILRSDGLQSPCILVTRVLCVFLMLHILVNITSLMAVCVV